MRVLNHTLLLKARVELGLTQEQAATAAGVDVRTYRRYESGEVNDPRLGFSVRHPSRRRILERLSAELGVAEDDLLVDVERLKEAPAEPAPAPEPAPALPSISASAYAPASDPARDEGSFRPLHVHTLQRARHFVGREDVLRALSTFASDPKPEARVIALVALGGAGKTAVAERFTAAFGDEPREGGVFVWSFYEDSRTESFLAQALAYFAPGAADGPPGDRLENLQAALRRGPPHLLVLDGLEIVQAEGGSASHEHRAPTARAHGELCDPALRRLLCAIARGLGAARAIVTSRFELTDLGPWEGSGLLTIRLASLSEAESASLLARWGIRGSAEARSELAAKAGGHALSVAMIGSYVGSFLGGDPARFDAAPPAEAARDDALARRLHAVLSAYAGALSREDRDLLARLCVFPSGVSEGALFEIASAGGAVAGSLAGLTRADLGLSLARLSRLGLTFSWREGGSLKASTHPFLREHFKALLGVSPDKIHALSQDRLAARLSGRPEGFPRDQALLDAFEELLLRALSAGRLVEAYSVYARSIGGFAHLGLRVGDMSRGVRIMRAFAAGDDPERMPASLPLGGRGMLAYEWGLYSGALGDLAFAVRCYEAHNAIAAELGDEASLATGLRTLSYTERLRGRLLVAREHIERSIATAERAHDVDQVARGEALFASIQHDLGEIDEAAARFGRLRARGVQPVARRGLWEAEHDLAIGRLDIARDTTERNLAVCSRLGWEGHVAHCNAVLGLIAAAEGDLAAARAHLEEARRWAGATGEVEMVLRCRELAARVALAGGAVSEAASEVEGGLVLADTCGFAHARTRLLGLAVEGEALRDPARAAAIAARAIAEASPEDVWGRADALHAAGEALSRAGEKQKARRSFGEALALRERLKHPGAEATRRALKSTAAS